MVNKPKLLLITYYWPPAGGAGVQRWLKMSRYLAKHFEISVFSPENADYPITDESLNQEIPENTLNLQNKIWEPYAWAEKLSPKSQNFKKGNLKSKEKKSLTANFLLWIRANYFIPDARMFWIPSSVKFLKKYLEKNTFDAVISTGPPHSTHLIALALKKTYPNLVWLADFRDPWTQIDYFEQLPFTSKSIKKHQKLENEVLKKADIVTSVSPSWAKGLENLGAEKVEVVYNGFDEEDFSIKFPKPLKNSLPEITYVGSLNNDRNPNFLWESLDDFLAKNPAQVFKLKFIGNIAEETKQKILSLKKLKEKTVFLDYMPHEQVIEHLHRATILLLLMNDTPNIQGIVPGKFFEYLAAERPILAIGKQQTDLDLILKQTQSGEMINFGDAMGVKCFLEKYLNSTIPFKPFKNNFTRASAAQRIQYLIEKSL
ncbi:colanic acid biosynthesis glycosyltransferase WcaL [Candidatus Ornithobacterium hominis]|uniref:glycosyltransferase family 4 protein n=1 Tax=Candidatus Ornithobacterium hominis TaxID=2497989 RepID=UPI000E5B03F0|nr:glycosyltransferase family 4 protein [Candidatus Ornithobacterium hominis]SZD73328.1 colanic acid biosynthesis glycosyltransferase WcaL [Candidatus Ornithobacterium hominis]